MGNKTSESPKNQDIAYINQKQIGVPHIQNQYWKMARQGMTKSLSNAFAQNLIDCYQVIVPTSGHTIIHQAVILDRHQLFKLCQVYGADYDKQDLNGVTALMKAVALNRTFYIQKLIQLGVDKQLKDNKGRTAKDYAEFYQNYQALDLIQE